MDWKSIDSAPRDGSRFLAVDMPDYEPYVCRWENDLYAPNGGRGGPSGWFADNWMDRWGDSPITERPTHWKPFGPPPQHPARAALDREDG